MKVLNPKEHSPTQRKNFPNPLMTLLFPLSPKIESNSKPRRNYKHFQTLYLVAKLIEPTKN